MQIPSEAQQYVDWKTFKKTSKTLSSQRQLFILKHSAGIAATGRNMVRRNERSTDSCPRCGSRDEHMEHIILCPHDDTKRIFNIALEELETWLSKTTNTEIKQTILEMIQEYRENKEPKHHSNISRLHQVKHNQQLIGTYPFMCGFLCKDWVQVQQDHLTRMGSRRCAQSWATQYCIVRDGE